MALIIAIVNTVMTINGDDRNANNDNINKTRQPDATRLRRSPGGQRDPGEQRPGAQELGRK